MAHSSSVNRPDLDQLLRERFGFEHFLEGQREVIEHLVAGRSSAAVFPTGGGKSLCYQLVATLIDGVTLVVSPLIALMKDQIDALERKGIPARRLDSTLSADEYREAMEGVRAGRVRLLYVAPERFNNERFRQSLASLKIGLFAVDEAHCISEWGHNFRPDYLKLARFAEQCGAERVLALTATATEPVLSDICGALGIDPACAVRTGFYRPNLELRTTVVEAEQRDATLLDLIAERERGPTIIYVTQQKTAERLAELLVERGLAAAAYHAGLADEERARVQDEFMRSSDGIVVATIAFGMGVDKPDIRYVYHYNLPKSLEGYAQEIGRAGRDGEPSTCELLVCLHDLNVLENFVYGDTPSRSAVTKFVRTITDGGDAFEVSEYDLAQACDIRNLVVRTLLTVLELRGSIEGGTPYYAKYRIRPVQTFDAILAQFEGERRTFLAGVFDQLRKARTWFDITLSTASEQLGQPRDRIVRALEYLSEQGLLEVRATGVRRRYRWLEPPPDIDALAEDLHTRLLARELAEIERLHDVLAYASHDGCQVGLLCEHFEQPLTEPCGHCSWCLQGAPLELPERSHPAIEPDVWARALEVRAEHDDTLSEPRAFARFLCGLSSPRLGKARLTRHPLHGALSHIPFADILTAAERGTPSG